MDIRDHGGKISGIKKSDVEFLYSSTSNTSYFKNIQSICYFDDSYYISVLLDANGTILYVIKDGVIKNTKTYNGYVYLFSDNANNRLFISRYISAEAYLIQVDRNLNTIGNEFKYPTIVNTKYGFFRYLEFSSDGKYILAPYINNSSTTYYASVVRLNIAPNSIISMAYDSNLGTYSPGGLPSLVVGNVKIIDANTCSFYLTTATNSLWKFNPETGALISSQIYPNTWAGGNVLSIDSFCFYDDYFIVCGYGSSYIYKVDYSGTVLTTSYIANKIANLPSTAAHISTKLTITEEVDNYFLTNLTLSDYGNYRSALGKIDKSTLGASFLEYSPGIQDPRAYSPIKNFKGKTLLRGIYDTTYHVKKLK